MPIYEYQCEDCDERFEKLVRMSTRPEDVECPQCGARHAQRVVSLMAAVGRGGASASALACAPSGGS